jgi:hypothetical protein
MQSGKENKVQKQNLESLLTEIRTLREQTLSELIDLTEEEFANPTDMARWDDVRRVLLRFGDHMREHATQVRGTRAAIGRPPTMAQRILGEAEIAWGRLLNATAGLTDDDVDTEPPDKGWNIKKILEHVRDTESVYLSKIRAARKTHKG